MKYFVTCDYNNGAEEQDGMFVEADSVAELLFGVERFLNSGNIRIEEIQNISVNLA